MCPFWSMSGQRAWIATSKGLVMPCSSWSLLGDPGLHRVDQLGGHCEPVVRHRVLACLREDIVHRAAPGDELAGGTRHVATAKHLLHLDLLHGVSSSGGRPRPRAIESVEPTLPPRVGPGWYEIRTTWPRGPEYGLDMKSHGQFCSMARALDLLGERWTLLIVRELLCGSRRFGEVQRGIPRISRTMLSARFRELVDAGVVARDDAPDGLAYRLTPAGAELAAVVRELGTWGQRWLSRDLHAGELDVRALVWDIQRRVRRDALPEKPLVVRIEF